MTFRAKPVARRSGRSGWGSSDRRTTLINFGFVGAIVVAVLILIGYTAWSWYEEHFGVAATVDGQVITRDDLRTRLQIEEFRVDYVANRIRTLMAQGRISPDDGAQQLSFLDQRRQALPSLSLERLIDGLLMDRLAGEEGVTVGDEDVSAQMIREATVNEQRHVWMIEVEPEVDEDSGQVEDPQRAAAKARAEEALADLRAGQAWEDVARAVSDASNAPQAGDLGWLAEESGYDEPFMTAVFAADLNVPTEVIEGEDDVFRIGRVTELGPEEVDPTFEAQIDNAGIRLEDYRLAVRADVVRERLAEAVVADLSQPGPQRHVLEIYLPEPTGSQFGALPAVKVRHILFSPNDDPDAARSLPSDDPAWQAARDEAEAAYAELTANPERFDAMARQESDEDSARETGGKQPWYDESSPIEEPFKDAILAPDLEPGQILQPVISSFGWHVIQFLRPYGEGDKIWAEGLKQQLADGADFGDLARDNSEGEGAGDGGDIGWIARGQLDEALETAIFETPAGSVSSVVVVDGDGVYLFKVLAEETREPTEEQIEIFETTGFSNWYTRKKEAADIEYTLAAGL